VKAARNDLLGSDSLLKLTLLSLHSASSHTLGGAQWLKYILLISISSSKISKYWLLISLLARPLSKYGVSYKYLSKLQVALDRYTDGCSRLLYRRNHSRQGKEKNRDAVLQWMDVDYFCEQLQNSQLQVDLGIYLRLSVCGRNRGAWCKHRCSSTSWSSKDTVDKYTCFVSTIQCRNNVKKLLDGSLACCIIVSWLVLTKSRP